MDFVIAILLGTIGSLIAAEVYSNGPSIADALIKRAVLQLPEHERARFIEEWRADNADFPGNIRKILHASGCIFGAPLVADTLVHLRPDVRSSSKNEPTNSDQSEEYEEGATVNLATGEIHYRVRLKDAMELYEQMKKMRDSVAHTRTDNSAVRKDFEYFELIKSMKTYLDRD